MGNSKIYSKIIYSRELEQELQVYIDKYPKGKVFLATEEKVDELWIAKLETFLGKNAIKKVVLPAGENNKKIASVEKIWQFLSENEGDRKSLLINIGGGMLTDLAGFAGSTFKRGIDFLNVPTTLLSQVDASVGGKTGFNFNGLKNEIGVFKEPVAVLINTDFLKTIDRENFISGFAEMIKHAFIFSADKWEELKAFDISNPDLSKLKDLVAESIKIKDHFVQSDPTENHIRKALNFGHTYGHAFESMAMYEDRAILHGYAVAFGMICELYLSHTRLGFPMPKVLEIANQLEAIYGHFDFDKDKYDELYHLMTHDKKNEDNKINFTLLEDIGKIQINSQATKEEVYDALYFYNNFK